ncbi:hypothetical protein BCR36DRAFT_407251 [Piromyces finnis]|uniref:Chitin-binding type-1 domain-containing protein n=1 Tax=Piromyces finnis TaxID=1754191 RepID=A0A1Y1UVK1_9FUNG|nr:hypothetical protein BCR36DRAFT_407251 [Piromyces finnis]|eukprot:ORX41996.1 hypothetical protein BCR36DRAFT_407251 [Piromyces finnis]
MKSYKFISALLLAANAYAKVTFKVVAVSGTPSVVINNKSYSMKLEQYPVYSVTLNDVNAPVKYNYALGSEKESFTRSLPAGSESTLNEFFNRSVTTLKHPLLPQAFPTFSTLKKSKLFDDTSVGTFLIEGSSSDIKKLHNNPNGDTKYNVKITFVTPYNIKVFNNGQIKISGQSTKYNKKLSYKISGLKTSDNKELFGRSAVKLRAEYIDPSFMREKTYFDMLNAIGVPSSQSRHVRVFINKQPIGLFLMTDDFSNKHFLKSVFNNGEKFTVDNAIFKVDSNGNLSYKKSKDNLGPYSYEGDDEKANKKEMLNKILVPFMKDVDSYPSTKKLNLDIQAFLRTMALEFLGYGTDNYWMVQGNYFIFKNMAKNMWYFIDSDFDMTFGHGSPDKCLKTTLDNYVLVKNNGSSRPLIDNIRSVSSNNTYLKNAVKTIIETVFNVNIAGPRIDSFAKLIKEDALWDFGLKRMSTYTGGTVKEKKYSKSDFEREIGNTGTSYPYPIKRWITLRSQNVASQFNMSIPSKAPSNAKYFEPEYETKSKKEYNPSDTIVATTATSVAPAEPTSDLPISKDRCGPGVAVCASGYCCSKYGWCGTTSDHCGTGCQSEFGKCSGNAATTTKKTTTTVKKTTTKKTTTKASLPTSRDECGSGVAVCASGYCCSKYGWCGKTKDHCSTGCQKAFGECW